MGLEHKLAMLNPTRVRLDGAGGGGGTLTPEIIAGALGSAREQKGVDLLIAQLVGITDYKGLENRLHDPLLFMAFQRGWIVEPPMTLQRMVRNLLRMALYEKLIPPRCTLCKGRCTRYNRKLKKEENCQRCKGLGTMELQRYERRMHLEVTLEDWERHWKRRYHDVQAWLDNLTGTAEAEIRRSLR